MQRPVMNPMLMEDKNPAPKGPPPKKGRLAWLTTGLRTALKAVAGLLFRKVFSFPRRDRLRIEDGPWLTRFLRSLLYRAAFVPVILVLFVIALVLGATHPAAIKVPVAHDPLFHGIYYDPVSFTSGDGTKLDAWLVPMYDARRVVAEKDRGLKKRHPAIVLAHNFGATKEQLLPLVKPLHEAGMVVMLVGLRGTGPSKGRGQTFGLREAGDVAAAIDLLRRRTYVDGTKIAVMGVGSGANAALIAAREDGKIAAVVLDRPVDGFDTAFATRIGRDEEWVKWLTPLCKWTFEVMYRVDTDKLNLNHYSHNATSRPTLRFDQQSPIEPYKPENVNALLEFLERNNLALRGSYASGQ